MQAPFASFSGLKVITLVALGLLAQSTIMGAGATPIDDNAIAARGARPDPVRRAPQIPPTPTPTPDIWTIEGDDV
ncbi:hypothetical protein EST38_g5651 [Candolleomyces aberdarensis]|uniref:Uncharacterized protein n=1 Tax=Candolleomyces aberdarensis TaxID=2316362 RepID=A0A4Q2DLS9_9AGAR|nr:hypothetical protein EST38_g5651 [Candolleomyces aberdarensis]